jgi:hypothetical protein
LGRPKRTPPTIDLDPSEISREESAAPAEPHEAASESEPPVDEEPAEPRQRPPWIPSAIVAAIVSAIVAGSAIGVSSWAGWLSPPPQAAPAAPQVDRASVDALAARVATIESKPAVPAVVDSTLAGRITAIEQSVAGLRKDVAGLTAQVEKSAAAINDLKSAPRENVSASPDLSAVTARLDQIEGATRALSSASAQRDAAPADDKPLRRVVAATLLDQLVRQGESYGAALTAAKPLASKPEQLKPLDRFAASGVPSANALCKELLTLIAGIIPAEPKVAEASGIVDRLKAGAERLVRIRRTGPQSGEGQAAILSRAAAAARLDDVATARRELNGLAAADRAPVQPWIEKADARDAALAASRQLAADATAALSKPAP